MSDFVWAMSQAGQAITNLVTGLFNRDILLVIAGSWITILAQVFGVQGPLRRLLVGAMNEWWGSDSSGKTPQSKSSNGGKGRSKS